MTWRVAGVADFNGDGLSDILWRNTDSGLLALWVMNGVNLASSVYLTPSSAGDPEWQIAALVDIKGDAKPDIIWQHATTGFLAAWMMDGAFMVSTVYLTPYQVGDLGWKIRGGR